MIKLYFLNLNPSRNPSEMYAEAFGFGAGACVAGCCGGGGGFDPFAQFRSRLNIFLK